MKKPNTAENREESLQKLGLTSLQAKIYSTLLDAGKEKTLTISKTANIDRSNTYRTILHLQNIGLVTKILNTPTMYQAVPMKDAVSTLINHKRDEYDNMKNVAQKLILTSSTNAEGFQQKEYEFKITKKDKKSEREEIIDACKNIKESFDLLINKKTFCEGVIDLAKEQLNCVRRGIKYRMITEKIDTQSMEEIINVFTSEPNFQIRYLTETPLAEIVINDRKVAVITLVPDSGLGERTRLETDHPGCVEMFQNHFDKIWNEAQEYKLGDQAMNDRKVSKRKHLAYQMS
jgi:sugar-specific transcriptional regulator TrmB